MVALMDEGVNSVGDTGQVQPPAVPGKPVSCHLIEVDTLGNVLWVWNYPSVTESEKLVSLKKFYAVRKRSSKEEEAFKFFRYGSAWFYLFLSKSLSLYQSKAAKLQNLDQVGVIVTASDFNPERYQIVTEILFRTYHRQADPTSVLQQFLSLIVSGTCELPKNKIFSSADYDTSLPFADFQIKAIISKFALETIVLLTALLRKQRIVIYHHDIDDLIKYVLSVPAIDLNTNSIWDSVYPWVGYNDEELQQFSTSKFHIIGCPNASIENRTDLYDIFVNIPAGEISVASHAKENMMMRKPHKEIALFMVQLVESNDISECDMINEIRNKARELSIDSHPIKRQNSDLDDM